MRLIKAVIFSMLGFLTCSAADLEEPEVIYLTWTEDPATTMTVQWQTHPRSGLKHIYYRSPQEKGWKSIPSSVKALIGTNVEVHHAHIRELTENTEVVFKIGEEEHTFRTMPKELSRPLRMVIGGDAYHGDELERFQQMNQVIASNEPDFVVVGGDIAYVTGKRHLFKKQQWEIDRWQTFLKEFQKTVKGKDGRMIPLLPIVGNHDVHHLLTFRAKGAGMFYEIFTFPIANKAYRALDFGNYLSLVMLDTEHTWPIEGAQTEWLEKTLDKNTHFPYLFAAYHVAAYPSHYPYDGKIPVKLRNNWVPLFEKYHLPFVFEHHNHTFKRTHPIKNGKIDPSGVTYLGDGAWAVPPRHVKTPGRAWYLLKSQSTNLCYFVTMTPEKCTIEAKNLKNEVIDQVEYFPTISPKLASIEK